MAFSYSSPNGLRSSKMTGGIMSKTAQEASEKKGYPTYIYIIP